MSTLIIAEKPSVGKEIASWIERHGKFGGGKATQDKTCIRIGSTVVSWCFGHVLEMKMPEEYNEAYARWRMEHLPIVPAQFEFKIKKGAAEQVRALGAFLRQAKEVIHAGDPDDEGQMLVSEVIDHFNYKGPVRRLWLNAIDDASITKAMNSLRPDSEFKGYYESALARSKADWLVGMNFSRACSIVGRARGATSALSVGRVQTPTLAMIVRREQEIRNFRPKDFFTPWLDLDASPGFRAKWKAGADDDRVDEDGKLLDPALAQTIVDRCKSAGRATVGRFTSEKKSESAALPFSLASLQIFMSSKHGMGVQQTLDIAQSLYEKKLTTYPRTDCEYLIESQHSEAAGILASLQGIDAGIDRAIAGANPTLKSRAWDSAKATAHHGIIPLARSSRVSLSPDELKVYLEIVKRFCLQFWPAAQYLAVSITLECAGEQFCASGRSYTSLGWRSAFVEPKNEDEEGDDAIIDLPQLVNGQVLAIQGGGLDKGTTRAPSRYTEGTLVEAMKAAHKLVTNEKLKKILKEKTGIGTEATRAAIIENLIGKKYIERKKKHLVPTAIAERLIDALPKTLSSVDLTAWWQQKMDDMREGRAAHEPFVVEQIEMIRKVLPSIEPSFSKTVFGEIRKAVKTRETTEKCPVCSSALRNVEGKYGWFFACSNDACKKLFRDVNGKPVARDEGKKTGHACQACNKGDLVLKQSQHGPYYQCSHDKCRKFFNQIDGAPEPYVPCPKCKKGHMSRRKGKDGFFWGCTEYRNGCRSTAPDKDGRPDFSAAKK